MNTMKTIIKNFSDGTVFTSLAIKGASMESKRQALNRMYRNKEIEKIGKGIYYRPLVDKEFGLGILYPSNYEIAKALEKEKGHRIYPTGDEAMNRLHLTTQIVNNAVFLTEGSRRNIEINCGNAGRIILIHTSNKRLGKFKTRLMLYVYIAMSFIGQKNFTETQKTTIKNLLNLNDSNISKDFKLLPKWIQRTLN